MTIAEQLNREKIEYRDGVTGWNKGRLKHLIDNTKYLGTEVYPPIIDQATYEKIQKTKHGRNTQKNTNKAQDIFKLTVPVRCPSCGDRMRRRHGSLGKVRRTHIARVRTVIHYVFAELAASPVVFGNDPLRDRAGLFYIVKPSRNLGGTIALVFAFGFRGGVFLLRTAKGFFLP